jgi:hypothetical protein
MIWLGAPSEVFVWRDGNASDNLRTRKLTPITPGRHEPAQITALLAPWIKIKSTICARKTTGAKPGICYNFGIVRDRRLRADLLIDIVWGRDVD